MEQLHPAKVLSEKAFNKAGGVKQCVLLRKVKMVHDESNRQTQRGVALRPLRSVFTKKGICCSLAKVHTKDLNAAIGVMKVNE